MIYIFLFQIVAFIIQLLVLRKVRAVGRLVDERYPVRFEGPLSDPVSVSWTWDDAEYEITFTDE